MANVCWGGAEVEKHGHGASSVQALFETEAAPSLLYLRDRLQRQCCVLTNRLLKLKALTRDPCLPASCQPQVAAAVDNRQQQSTTPLPVKGGFQSETKSVGLAAALSWYCSHHFNWKVGEPLPQCNRLFSSVVPAGILPGEGGG
ncbi:hypothetical protein WJX74_001718 [Apatococcus lobatus]|uniref:Uncharacterized protein n=1 Tax=Apatococcus lobatus TaxID=904363 RepID=A0AAW1RL14_9CHLO